MSVGSVIGGGINLVRTQPRVVAIWAGLYLAAMIVALVASRPWMAATMAFQQQAAANAAAGITTPPALPREWFALVFLFDLLFLILFLIAFAAVVRAVTRPTGDRFAYLRLGMDELRLIGLCVLLAIAGFLAEIVGGGAIALIAVVIWLLAGKMAGIVAAALLALVLFCGLIYAEVRLSLAGALTVMRHRIVIRDAWRATQGSFWTLFGVYALLLIGFFVMTIIAIALTDPHLLAAYASLDPQAATAAAQERMARQNAGLSVGLIVQIVISTILGVVASVIACGAVATAAVELGEPAAIEDWT